MRAILNIITFVFGTACSAIGIAGMVFFIFGVPPKNEKLRRCWPAALAAAVLLRQSSIKVGGLIGLIYGMYAAQKRLKGGEPRLATGKRLRLTAAWDVAVDISCMLLALPIVKTVISRIPYLEYNTPDYPAYYVIYDFGRQWIELMLLAVVFALGKLKNRAAAKEFLSEFTEGCKGKRMDTPQGRERVSALLESLLQKHHMASNTGVEAFFAYAVQAEAKEQEKLQAEAIASVIAAEKRQCDKLSEGCGLYGGEKRVYFLTREIDYINQTLNAETNAALRAAVATKQLGAAFQKPEHDSALLGGIAAGVAGGAYGAATYLSHEADNQRIREENAALQKQWEDEADRAYRATCARAKEENRERDNGLRRERSRLKVQVEAAKSAVVSEEEAGRVLERLTLSRPMLKISQTGTCTVQVIASCAEEPTVQEGLPAVVDGTIDAEICDRGQVVGTAALVLPAAGLGTAKVTLKGMCLTCADAARPDDFSVRFRAKNLFLIEKMKQ